MPLVAMAAGAFLREQLWALRQSIIAQKRSGAFGWDSLDPGQNTNSLGLPVGRSDGNLVTRISTVLGDRQIGEQSGAGKQAVQHSEVEAMAQFPAPKKRHEEYEQHHQSRDDNCAPDFGAAWEQLQELKQEEEIP